MMYMDDVDDLRSQCKDLEDENKKLKAKLVVLKADEDILNQNHKVLVGVIEQLQAQVNLLASHPTGTCSQGIPTHTPSQPKITDPPRFKGKTQDLTVEQ